MIESPSIELKQIISPELAWKYGVIPKKKEDNEIQFYIDKNAESNSIKAILQALLSKPVSFVEVETETIKKALSLEYRKSQDAEIRNLQVDSDSFLDKLIEEAADLEASDIHLEVQEENARIRMRIDGVLLEKYAINKIQYPSLINKIKIKANLNISEKRLPQDGRILVKNKDFSTDIRVSILPTLHGEKVVLRLLNKDATDIQLDTLGMSTRQLDDYKTAIKNPHGILLISGPTGSGKTTTLYATLKILNDAVRNIITIEDPIEYTLDGINQVQLREAIGLDFSKAIKTFLRQDPDIIMLGEIRDTETANMAVRAALTGHLVLSTIHTNSAWGIITRLSDMDVPPYLLANTINMVLAQRLVRALCTNCKIKNEAPILWPQNYVAPRKDIQLYKPIGCSECHHTGYKGRKAIYEIIPVSRELQEEIRNKNTDINEYLDRKGIRSLSDSVFELLEKGETSFEEALPILLSDSK